MNLRIKLNKMRIQSKIDDKTDLYKTYKLSQVFLQSR